MPPMIEFPLDLSEVRVLKTELKKREVVITVESTRHYAICSRCGEKTFEFHINWAMGQPPAIPARDHKQ